MLKYCQYLLSKIKYPLFFNLIFFILTFGICSEVIYLKNGNVINGEILNQDESWVSLKTKSNVVKFQKKEIKKISYNNDLEKEKSESKFIPKNNLDDRLYTAYNIWYTHPEKIHDLNYKEGEIIPAGTPVDNIEFVDNENIFFLYRKLFTKYKYSYINFNIGEKRFKIFFNQKYYPATNMLQFKDRLFTNKGFDHLVGRFNYDEINAIKKGKIIKGMRKDAVIVSYGYPPEHKTPALSENRWIYYFTRSDGFEIVFDSNGLLK